MTSLFNLTGDALALQRQIDAFATDLFDDDADVVAAATTALENLIDAEAGNRRAIESKADAWCWMIDTIRARSIAQRDHARRLAELADDAERQAQALQDQLIAALSRVDPDATTWTLPEHRLSSRRSSAVEIDPDVLPQDLPAEYQRIKTTISADRTALAAALKAGAVIDGARLISRRSWRIG